jgi:Domain of unknown function (DUF4082)
MPNEDGAMRRVTCGAFIALFAFASAVNAGPIIDFTGGITALNNNNETYGYSFTVSGGNISVNGLGVFSAFSSPLAGSHPVGLWNSSGTLLASATVTPGSTAVPSTDSLGQWLEVGIAPVVLTPGTYFAGVYYNQGTEQVLVVGTPNSIPGVTYNSAQYDFGNSLAFPESAFPSTLVGPALFSNPVPEPASVTIFGLMAAGCAFYGWRRRSLTIA